MIEFRRSSYPQQQSLPFQSLIPLHLPSSVPNELNRTKSKPLRQRTSTSSLPSNFLKLEGRSRYSNISKLPQIRVLKRDIRRRYLEMFHNVCNAHDMHLYSRFMYEFCTPNCHSVIHLPFHPIPVVRSGIETMIRDNFINSEKFPDGIIKCAGDVKIHVPLQTRGSRIVALLSFRGTHLFDDLSEHGDLKLINTSIVSSPSSSSSISEDHERNIASNIESNHSSEDMIASLLSSFKSLRLSPNPIPKEIDVNATLTMHLDESNRIEKFVIDSLSISSRIFSPLSVKHEA